MQTNLIVRRIDGLGLKKIMIFINSPFISLSQKDSIRLLKGAQHLLTPITDLFF